MESLTKEEEEGPWKMVQTVKLEPPVHPMQISISFRFGGRELARYVWLPTLEFIPYEMIEEFTAAIERFMLQTRPQK